MIFKEETSLFIRLEPFEDADRLSLLFNFRTVAFSPFFLLTKLDSPDLALDTFKSLEEYESEIVPKAFKSTLGAPFTPLLISISTSLSYLSIYFLRAEVFETLSLISSRSFNSESKKVSFLPIG